jgi:hypothetical protein
VFVPAWSSGNGPAMTAKKQHPAQRCANPGVVGVAYHGHQAFRAILSLPPCYLFRSRIWRFVLNLLLSSPCTHCVARKAARLNGHLGTLLGWSFGFTMGVPPLFRSPLVHGLRRCVTRGILRSSTRPKWNCFWKSGDLLLPLRGPFFGWSRNRFALNRAWVTWYTVLRQH